MFVQWDPCKWGLRRKKWQYLFLNPQPEPSTSTSTLNLNVNLNPALNLNPNLDKSAPLFLLVCQRVSYL